MKMFQTILIILVCAALSACNNPQSTYRKAKQIENILAGKEVPLKELPRLSEEKSDQSDSTYTLRPYHYAKELGYPEEDLKKLEDLVVKLPSAEKLPEK